MNVRAICGLFLAFCCCAVSTNAALIVNSAQPITQRVNVQIVQVADNAGTNPAPLFGTAGQQAAIFDFVDQIWAQAGVDINFEFRAGTYNSTFALSGTAGSNNPRPTTDLDTILSNAGGAGVLSPNSNTLNLFMVRIVPGFSQTSDNTSNGLAILNGNGITVWAGPNLPGFSGGQEVIATVLAHEIGHNLNLDHIVQSENLMQAGGSPNPGQRLNSTQITAALNSPFSVPIPEPSSALLALIGSVILFARRRRHF